MNMIGSALGSVGNVLRVVGIEKEDEKGLKDEQMLYLIFL